MYRLSDRRAAPRPKDEAVFEKCYRDAHLPVAATAPNLRRLVMARADSGIEGGASAFCSLAKLVFESKFDLEPSEHSEESAAMRAHAGVVVERLGVSLEVAVGDEVQVDLEVP